ncbi:MAG: MliC family protein [Atribacterota bacterium]|nr:MliC family protein [Atribacterota bacterium]MDD4896567.1 MliC family protein [Atribacterota bacterium]MDD5637936.1 MliC family protein [Atribacterota bacterium]
MKKKTVIILVILFLVIIVAGIDLNSKNELEQKYEESYPGTTDYFVFSCPCGDEIKIRYDNKNNEAILLFNGQNYILQRVISGSGSRYANDDESIVFWEHQGEVILEIDGEIVAQNCVLDKGSDDWKEFKSNDIIFQAPEYLEAEYVSFQKWPPEIKILTNKNDWPWEIEIKNEELACQTSPEESSFSRRFYKQNINGRNYCIRAESEGAAGSVYTDYTYFVIYKGNLISINFVLRFSNCSHYPEPKRIECFTERETFDIGNTINEIAESISFTSGDSSLE